MQIYDTHLLYERISVGALSFFLHPCNFPEPLNCLYTNSMFRYLGLIALEADPGFNKKRAWEGQDSEKNPWQARSHLGEKIMKGDISSIM